MQTWFFYHYIALGLGLMTIPMHINGGKPQVFRSPIQKENLKSMRNAVNSLSFLLIEKYFFGEQSF